MKQSRHPRLATLTAIANAILLAASLSGCRSVGVQREAPPTSLNAAAESPRFDEIRRLLLEQLEDPKARPDEDPRAQTVDLDAILERVEQTNPIIAMAEEAIRGAEAERTLASAINILSFAAEAIANKSRCLICVAT